MKSQFFRGKYWTPATCKSEFFAALVNGWKSLINVTETSIVDVAGILDTDLIFELFGISPSRIRFREISLLVQGGDSLLWNKN